jgi:hypothetical protein
VKRCDEIIAKNSDADYDNIEKVLID